MRVDLTTFKKNIKFSDLTEATLTEFVAYMRDSKKLRTPRKKKGERDDYDQEDLVGLKNSTIEKKLGYLRWFLNWATDRGYNTNLDYQVGTRRHPHRPPHLHRQRPVPRHHPEHRDEMDRPLRLQGHEALYRHCGLHQGKFDDEV